jgi:CPA1 family monovalent cation:H+ antiporter
VLGDRQDIINIIFGVVLFTLLVQGLTTQWVLEKLDLVGDQPIRQEYSEYLARRVALKRVANYLNQLDLAPDVEEEFYRYERDLVTGELVAIEEKIEKLQNEHPQLRELDMKQLRDTLLDIEADTYAEFIRVGRLNKDLSPLLQEVLVKATEKDIHG